MVPERLRSDNGLEFVAEEVQERLASAGVRRLYIQKTSSWENGYVESFNGRLRDELLGRELFLSVPEDRAILDQWRMDYSHRRPHGGLKWLTPAAFVAGLDDTPPGVWSRRRGVVCQRSGLRSFLRHTTRTVPILSHERWYRNWGGVMPQTSWRLSAVRRGTTSMSSCT